VITKSPSEIDGTETGALLGSFRTQEAWLLHREIDGDLKGVLMADFRGTEGHKREITADAQTRLDNRFGTQASKAPGAPSLSQKEAAIFLDIEKFKWRLRGSFHQKTNIGSGQGVSEALDPDSRFTYSRQTVDLTYHDPQLTEHWDLTTQLAFYHGSQEIDSNLTLFPPGANLGNGVFPNGVIGNPEFWERNLRFNNSAFYTGLANHRIRLGAGYQFLDLYKVQASRNFYPANFAPRPNLTDVTDTSEIYLPEKSRTGYYVYAQDEWNINPSWDFTAGLRYDLYSDFDGTLNPRAALVWKTKPDLTTKLLYGRAFRAPTFVELYTINNPVAIGNPNLKPETNDVYELAWAYQATPKWSIGLNLFRYQVNNLIVFVKDPTSPTATAQNYGSQSGSGFEFETKVKSTADLFLTGSYSYLEAKNETAGKPSGSYPNRHAYLRDDWSFISKWIWGNQINWVGPQDREPGDTRDTLKEYTTVDVIFRHQTLSDQLSFTASVRNIFDADAREPSSGPGPTSLTAAIPNDLPQAGRSGFLEMSYRY
jgi:iron complex outermembrane receptor protein